MNEKAQNPLKTILLTGLVAGTLDILAAFANAYLSNAVSPIRVLQFIASGLLGKNAFEGGLTTAGLGLLLHFIIAFSWTILFFFLYPKIKQILTNPIITGLVYGLIIWLIMNLAVLPMSNINKQPFSLNWQTFIGIGILMLFVGLPISIMVNRYYSNK